MEYTERARAAEARDEGKGERGWSSGLTLTTAAFLFLLLRLFAVSGYQWHTAFAVLHTLDLDDSIGIVLGTVLADAAVAAVLLAVLLPAFLFRVVGGFLLSARLREEGRTDPRTGRWDLAGIGLLAIAVAGMTAYVLSFHRWWLLLVSLGVTALMVGLGALARRAHGQVGEASRWAGRHLMGLVLGVAIVAMLLSAALVRTPWMPLERIEVKGLPKALHGYVLEAEPGFLKVLTEREREFLILRDGEVESREEIVDH
ncbi:hypothetical protein OG897_07565 [Streptomyces sp. NBC_00237]|uniref:hypothetical protein n=1 Tax=Streptomyces sp. NBC_00237 TaxID=2975687 RepID=UPI002251517D|nr:hypothetical protein [Streptomyces sp. NBC_00237]MCX5201311.1 hypothetical protein [Streptomyces sp. NBC_00237]